MMMISPSASSCSSSSFNELLKVELGTLKEQIEINPEYTHTLIVKGMTCAACSSSIESTLMNSNLNLKSVKIDLFNQTVTVTINPEINNNLNHFRIDRVVEKIKSIGFTVVASSSDWKCRLEARKRSDQENYINTKDRFIKVFIFGIPVIISSWQIFALNGGPLLSLIFSLPLHFYAARDLYISAFRTCSMERLIAINSIATLLFSIFFFFHQHGMFDCAALVLILFTGGKLLEGTLKRKITGNCDDLLISLPKHVRLNEEKTRVVSVNSLSINDVFQIRSDELIPIDGEIETGEIFVNESTLTGEAMPRHKRPGDHVLAGTRVTQGDASIIVNRTVENSFINKLARGVYEPLLNESDSNKESFYSIMANDIARLFIPGVVLISLGTFICWLLIFWISAAQPRDLIPEWRNSSQHPSTPLAASIYFALTVLCVACPCALSIATPIAVVVVKSVAFRKGILLRDPKAFESATGINVLLFDKTGTLTTGKPSIHWEYMPLSPVSVTLPMPLSVSLPVPDLMSMPLPVTMPLFNNEESFVLEACKLLEEKVLESQEHPIARSIHNYCKSKLKISKSSELTISDVKLIAGQGVSGVIKFKNKSHVIKILKSSDNESWSLSQVLIDERLEGKFRWFDELKPEALEIVNNFRSRGFSLGLISGDSQSSTERTSETFLPSTFDYVFGDCNPEDKGRIVDDLKFQGFKVAFCGDGLNDGVGMSKADFSISLDPQTQITSVNSLQNKLSHLPLIFRYSKLLTRQIRFNFLWAAFYNLLAIPLAMGTGILIGIPPIGPEIGTALMVLSGTSILVTSLFLLNFS